MVELIQWVVMGLIYWVLVAKLTPERYSHWAGRTLFLLGSVASYYLAGEGMLAYTATAIGIGAVYSFKVEPNTN